MSDWSAASEGELPLDVSEFRCVMASPARVVVVFLQTQRRYTYVWRGGELDLAEPEIEGECGEHPAEVIDCLARAVAYRSTREPGNEAGPAVAPRTLTTQLRNFLMMRG